MHSRVSQTPERFLRQFGALLILLTLIGPLALQHPAASAQGDNAPGELTELWTFDDIEGVLHDDPLYFDGVVFATSRRDGTLHAIDAESGDLLWESIAAPTAEFFDPAVGEGLLITLDHDWENDAGRLIALEIDREGNEERWSVEFDADDGEPTGQPIITPDGTVLVHFFRDDRSDDPDLSEAEQASQSTFTMFDSEDGTELWSGAGGYYVKTILSDTGLIVSHEDGFGYSLVDTRTGTNQFSVDLKYVFLPVLEREGTVYGVTDKDLIALDLETGDILWSTPIDDSFAVPSTYDERSLYLKSGTSRDGFQELQAFDLVTGELRWTTEPISGRADSGIVEDGYLYTKSSNNATEDGLVGVIVFDTETGEVVAQLDTWQRGFTVANGVIFAGDETLIAYSGPGAEATGDSGGGSKPGNEQSSGETALDIATMALTPWDLDDAGLENYGHGFSEMVFIESFASQIAANRDISEDDVLDELDAAGFVRAYFAYFYPPDDADTDQVVVSYVLEFADEDGASDAFEFLEDESDDANAEDLDGFDDLGDASEATLLTGEDPDTGDPFAQIDTTVLIGNLHAGVAVVDWTGEEPDENLVTDLIDFALERVEDGFDADQPALSNQVVRLSGDSVSGYYDTYTLRDGEAIWFTGETADTADAQEDDAEDAGTIEEYRVWQHLATWGDDQADSLWSYISLIRFEDENAAEAWMADREGIVEGDEGFTDVEIEDAEYGDAAFTYTAVTADGAFTYRGITFQLGEFVATLDMSAPLEPSAEAIAALADEQLACLEDGGCLEPIKLPRAVEGFVADAEDSAGPEEDETPEAEETAEADETEEADGGPVLYESEEYDFTIAFDLNDWQFTPDEGPTDDGYEWLNFENGISTVWIAANPDYGSDELSDCVENFVAALGWEDAWELETLGELTDEDGRAFVSYTLNNSLLGLSAYLSVECRSIDDDASLMITHYADTDAEGEVPEDEVALVQELIDGIQITESTGEASDDETSASSGASYTSEEWGYTIAWDPEYWRRVGADQEEGIQLNYRFNTLASVRTSVSDADGGDPNACVQASIDRVNEGDGSDLVAADDLPAPELPNGAVGGLFLLGDSFVMYLECRPIVEGESSLRIVFTAPDENWEDILPDLENLLDGIQTPGDSGDSGEAGDAGSGDEADSAAAGESYTSEEWGYTVTWDPEYWAEAGASLDEGIRLGFQFNTLASVTIFAVEDDGGDPQSCFEASTEDDGEGSELVAADDLPAPDLAEGAVGGVFMLGDFATMYFECRPLVEGESALRIAFGAPDENWEELLPYLEDILAGIIIPEDGD